MSLRPFMAQLLAGRLEREHRAMQEAEASRVLYAKRHDSQVERLAPAMTDLKPGEDLERYHARKREESTA